MKLILTGHNLKVTQGIEDHVIDKITKLDHFESRALDARVILEHDTTKPSEKRFKCSVRLAVPGPDLFAEDCEADLYAAIDLVTKKIEQQIRKRQNKYKARKHKLGAKSKMERQEKLEKEG
ncbi:MAG: ribosome-associated translation inhibitor RaiA [Verrucomicrobia bacterium]|nr:ribosome-associated translation inhibitor RaiA [Verrucomicrobiota bacterium]